MKKFIPLGQQLLAIFLSFALFFSSAAPAVAKKSSSRKNQGNSSSKKSPDSTPAVCLVPLDKNEEKLVSSMIGNPSGSDWKDASNVRKITKWLKDNPGCKKKYRGNVSRGCDTAIEACRAAFDNARKKFNGNPDICEANKALIKTMRFEFVTTLREWDGSKYVPVEPKKSENGNGNSSSGDQKKNKTKQQDSTGDSGTGLEDKVEQKVEAAEDENKDNALVLEYRHEVDTSFMIVGGKGELTEQEKEWIKLFNEANSVNAKLDEVLKTAVDMYVNPDKYSSADRGVPAYVMQYLFMTYADLIRDNELNKILEYVNYKCNGEKDRCEQIRSFASEAVLMQVRFRDKFDEKGRGSLVDKYFTPVCQQVREQAAEQAAAKTANGPGNDTRGAEEAMKEFSDTIKACLAKQMRAYVLVKGKKAAQEEAARAIATQLKDPKFKNQPVQSCFWPGFIMLMSSYFPQGGLPAVTQAPPAMITYAQGLSSTTYSAIGGTAEILELSEAAAGAGGTLGGSGVAAGEVVTVTGTAQNVAAASSITTTGELSSFMGAGALAEAGGIFTVAAVLIGVEMYEVNAAFSASYPNAAAQLKGMLKSTVQSSRSARLQQQQQQQNQQQQNQQQQKQATQPKENGKPKNDEPDPNDKNKPRCQDEAKKRRTCQFRTGTTDWPEFKLHLLGDGNSRGGISFNLSDKSTASRREELFECLQKAGLCPAGPVDFTQQHIFGGCEKVSSLKRKILPKIAAAGANGALSPTAVTRCETDLMELSEAVKMTHAFVDDRGRPLDHVQALYRGAWVPSVEVQIGLTDKTERLRILAQLVLDNFDLNKLINALSWELDEIIGAGGKNRVRRGNHEKKLHGCAPGADGKFPSRQKWFDGRNLGSDCLHFHYEEWKTYQGGKPYVCNHALFYKPSDMTGEIPCKK